MYLFTTRPVPKKTYELHYMSLKSCGLSRQKITYLKSLSDAFLNKTIKFESLKVNESKNYQSLEANFKISDENNSINLKPEVRVYDQPQTITSEADIKSTLYSDNFLVFNILKNDGFYNVRYQIKPFMIWIWISIILISFGGILSIVKKNG